MRRPSIALVGAIAVVVVLVGGMLGVRAITGGGDRRAGTAIADVASHDHDVTITPGTAAAIRAGDDVEIVPRELLVHVGETLTQRFMSAGVLEGAGSIHPTGRLTVRVDA